MKDEFDFKEQKDKFKLKIDDEIHEMFPPMDEEIYEILKNDIKDRGIQEQLIVTEDGTVVCGCNRFKIAQELKIPEDQIPYKTKSFGCRMEMLEYALKDNIIRRQLNVHLLGLIVKEYEHDARTIKKWCEADGTEQSKGKSGRKPKFLNGVEKFL